MCDNTLITLTIHRISSIYFIVFTFRTEQSKFFSCFNYNIVIISRLKLINNRDLSAHRVIAYLHKRSISTDRSNSTAASKTFFHFFIVSTPFKESGYFLQNRKSQQSAP